MGCSCASLEQHQWEPQREEHRGDDHARQDLHVDRVKGALGLAIFTTSQACAGAIFS